MSIGIFERWVTLLQWGFHLRSALILERFLEDPIPTVEPRVPIQIKELAQEDVPSLMRFRPYYTESLIRERVARQERCFLAYHQGQLVHCGWVSFRNPCAGFVHYRLSLKPGQAYIYNAYTDPSMRGMRLMQTVWVHILRALKSARYKSVLSLVGPTNHASLAALQRLGFRVRGNIFYRRILGRRTWRIDWEKTAPAVFVLGLSLSGLNVIRNFSERGIPVVGIDCDPEQIGFRSRLGEKVCVPSPEKEPEMAISELERLRQRFHERPILFPTNDLFALFLARHRERLSNSFRLNTSDAGLVESLIDKVRFSQLMAQHGIAVPRTYCLNGSSLQAARFAYPCVVKPIMSDLAVGRNGHKGFYVHSEQHLGKVLESLGKGAQDMFIQEAIPGSDSNHYSCATYIDGSGRVAGLFTSRKLRQYPPTIGVACLCESRWDSDVARLGLRVLRAIGFRGLAEVEMKQDDRDGMLKVIEINPRSWLQNRLAKRAGVDLEHLAYESILGQPAPARPKQVDGIKWIALRWDLMTSARAIRKGRLTVGEWLRSLRGPKILAYADWRDPKPFFLDMWKLGRSLWRKLERAYDGHHPGALRSSPGRGMYPRASC